MMDTSVYPFKVFRSEEDGGFIAEALDLPGCSAFGETQAEAAGELQDAIDAWIDAATAVGNPVPPPSDPTFDGGFSGRIVLRMPKTLHARLTRIAKQEGNSLNTQLVVALTEFETRWTVISDTIVQSHQVMSSSGYCFSPRLSGPNILGLRVTAFNDLRIPDVIPRLAPNVSNTAAHYGDASSIFNTSTLVIDREVV